jgi:hypothetical protein
MRGWQSFGWSADVSVSTAQICKTTPCAIRLRFFVSGLLSMPSQKIYPGAILIYISAEYSHYSNE